MSSDFCPFQQGALCTAREPRPLGCRVYYCDPAYQETSHAITEKYLRRLKELAETHGVTWQYAPLHVFLNETDCDSQVVNAHARRRQAAGLGAARATPPPVGGGRGR